MGSSQSVQEISSDDEEGEEEEEEEEAADGDESHRIHDVDDTRLRDGGSLVKKVLQQEPEMLPCHASASPLSPQLSSFGTPRLGPSIKVWDPYNVLAPPPHFPRTFSSSSSPSASDLIDDDLSLTHLYFICHGESHIKLRPDLIAGRCPEAALTSNGKRQARALAVFLKSQGVRFNAVYTSPLDRARATALLVCQEVNFMEEHIQSSEALVEMSQGHWEGCHRSDIFTAETQGLMERFQPDFCAPSGESLRQVEFRMVQFVNSTILTMPEKVRSDFSPPYQNENQGFAPAYTNSIHERDGSSLPPAHWDGLHGHRQGISKKKSGKSRLQIVTNNGGQEADDEMSPREPMSQGPLREASVRVAASSSVSSSSSSSSLSCIGVFTHAVPIKCILTGILGCSAAMSNKICIEDSSVTVLHHSLKTGWQIKRLNDTAHLRLL